MNLKSNKINIDGKLYEQNNITGDLTPLTEFRKATKGAGRPPAITINENYQVIRMALTLGQNWINDIIYGSCTTSAGVSNGRLNVRIKEATQLLCLPKFSSKDVGISLYTFNLSDRRQRLVAQAARHALDGINHYLQTHKSLWEALENFVLERGTLGWQYAITPHGRF